MALLVALPNDPLLDSVRYAARRDENEDELVKVATKLGAWVVYAPPLDFWIYHRGTWTPVEIKGQKGTYTGGQKTFLTVAKIYGAPAWTWRTETDVLKSLGATRAA
jgi:hypothetical protein